MSKLKLSFLGSPQIEHYGRHVEIGASKALALLVYLAVTRQNHSRDALSTLLWPDSDQSRARTYLRHALWSLKKELGEEWLNISRTQIGLRADVDVWLDVQAFQAGMTAVTNHDHSAGQMCPDCLARLQEAVALYRDNFLAGFTLPDSPAFDEWQFFQAEALRQLLATALERLVQEYTHRQEYESAIAYARRWLSLDVLHEPVHRILMRLYALAGQQAAALRQYQECVRLLEEELSVAPEAETNALYETIRTRQLEPPLITDNTESARLPHSPERYQTEDLLIKGPHGEAHQHQDIQPDEGVTSLVAREQELKRLAEMLDRTLDGRSQLAFVLGEAGQGKTALLQAFAHRAHAMTPGLIVAGGNCNAYTGLGDPYLPFREILALLVADMEAWPLIGAMPAKNAKNIQRLLPETIRSLVETAPDLIDTFVPLTSLLESTSASRLAQESWRSQLLKRAGQSLALDPNLQQSALLDQYARLLQALAQRAPLLLLLDDLQWADPGSVALLFHLGRRLAHAPLFIVGAYRPDEVARGQDGQPHPLARVVHELQRVFGDILIDLSQAEGEKFIDAWLDSEPNRLGKFFRQTLYRQTGGHPLFTIELLQAMRERGDLEQDENGVWQVQTSINWNRLPARVEGAIGERIKRLDPALQELLQVASVEGEEFTAELIARVLQRQEREIVRLLSQELDKVHGLVRALGTRRAGERRFSRYRFRHILIQRYLYNLLDDVERIYQHEAVGRSLETLYDGQAAETAVQLARHFEIAQLPEKAAAYLHLAGNQARRAAALPEAVRHYKAALSHWPDEDDAGRAALLRKLGECQWMTGRADDALETFETGYNLFQALDDVEAAGAMQRLIGRVYWEIGNREKSLHHYQQALTILETLPDSVELAWTISSISQMHMLAWEYEQAIEWGERALDLAKRLEAETVIVHALNNVGTAHFFNNRPEQGRTMLEESIRRAAEGNLPHDACRGHLNLAGGLGTLGLYKEARAAYEKLYNYANRVHIPMYAAGSLIELTGMDWQNGRWRDALAQKPQIQDWLEQGPSMAYAHVIAAQLFGQQFNDLGQPQAAYAVLESSLSLVRSYNEFQFTGPHLMGMARALIAEEDNVEAKQVIDELLDILIQSGNVQTASAETLLFCCDPLPSSIASELPIDKIIVVLEDLAQNDTTRQIPSQNAAVHEVQGAVALFQEKPEEAVSALRQAGELWQKVERPYDQARGLNKLGEAFLLASDFAGAHDAFTQANALVEQLAGQLDDEGTKAAFLQSPLARAIQNGLHESETA